MPTHDLALTEDAAQAERQHAPVAELDSEARGLLAALDALAQALLLIARYG